MEMGAQAARRIRRSSHAAILRLAGIFGTGAIALARLVGWRKWRTKPVESPPDWRQVAKQVHAELGGDLPALLQAADRIEARYRHQFERVARDLARAARVVRRRVRYAAWGLSAVVPAVVAVGATVDPGYLQRLTGSGLSRELAGATLLALGGTWWLHRMSRPPYPFVPFRARKHKREARLVSALGNLLDRGAIYAAAGLGVADALVRAARADPDGPGARLLPLLSSSHAPSEMSNRERESPMGRCALALIRRLEDGAAPADALALTANQLRLEHQWATWHRVAKLRLALVLPLLTCILPAALLLRP
jgi:hypothetical protein